VQAGQAAVAQELAEPDLLVAWVQGGLAEPDELGEAQRNDLASCFSSKLYGLHKYKTKLAGIVHTKE